MKIERIIDGVLKSLINDSRLKQSSLKRHYKPGFNFIANYYKKTQGTIVDDSFLADCYKHMSVCFNSGGLTAKQFSRYGKCISVLKQYMQEGATRHEHRNSQTLVFAKTQGEKTLLKFIKHEKIRLSESTVKSRANIIRQLLAYHMESTGLDDLGKLTVKTVSSFIEHMAARRPAGLGSVVSAIRPFVLFLFKTGVTRKDLSSTVNAKVKRRHRICGVFTSKESGRILSQINLDDPLGKRDMAIILLAYKNGLRGNDIINLKLADINWKESEIVIVQKKTMRTVACPIDLETGNALADYILNARPDSVHANVFLSAAPQNRPFTSSNLCVILKKYMAAAGVEKQASERTGFHAFRRGLATDLLENDTDLEAIAQILGHGNSGVTQRYMSIAERKLAECCLPMPGYNGRFEVEYA